MDKKVFATIIFVLIFVGIFFYFNMIKISTPKPLNESERYKYIPSNILCRMLCDDLKGKEKNVTSLDTAKKIAAESDFCKIKIENATYCYEKYSCSFPVGKIIFIVTAETCKK